MPVIFLNTSLNAFDPLQKAFWGDTFGVLDDKYARQWMFVYHEA
jgi:uncharacterized glyoxalase superfamily protein PhnB